MENINIALIAPLFIIQLILMVVALLDLRKIHATNGPKWMWILIIVFVNTIGPIIYFIAGRKN
jgi:hypothetical protein